MKIVRLIAAIVPGVNKECGLNIMRIAILAALFVTGVASGNPQASSAVFLPNIDLEKFVVSISSTDATFTESFTFGPDGVLSEEYRTVSNAEILVMLPIWIPENTGDDPATVKFWKELLRGIKSRPKISDLENEAIADSIGLKIRLSPDGPTTVPVSFDAAEGEAIVGMRWAEPGFISLVARFFLPADVAWNRSPVKISYHHPLVRRNGEGLFYYAPSFFGVPATASTSDTNRYAVTIQATQDCSLTVNTVDQKIAIAGGHSVTLPLQHLDLIRVTSKQTPIAGR
jgi:hypothetical protein